MTARDASAAPGHFNLTARVLHWLMAAMILSMLFLGAGMVSSLEHRPLGIAILVLAIVRLANRLRHRPPPLPLPSDLPRWQVLAAHASHWLLYALMLAMPLLGWGRRAPAALTVKSPPSGGLSLRPRAIRIRGCSGSGPGLPPARRAVHPRRRGR